MNAKRKSTRITKALIVDAVVWLCPFYAKEGVFSYCQVSGEKTNCTKETCSRVSDFFKTINKIDSGEIVVF